MSNPSAITEVRAWTVRCRRHIVDRCHLEARVDADHDVRSTAGAEQALRDAGWTLHADGTASCPECLAAWNGQTPLLETAIAEYRPDDGEYLLEVESAIASIAEIDQNDTVEEGDR